MATDFVKKCCCSFSWLNLDDDDEVSIIQISHRKTTLPTEVALGDAMNNSNKVDPNSAAKQQHAQGHPRYIRVKQRESSRYKPNNKSKQIVRSDSTLSHFSSIFQKDDMDLGQAVLAEVRTRSHIGLERILSELEEHPENTEEGQSTSAETLATDFDNPLTDKGKALKKLMAHLEDATTSGYSDKFSSDGESNASAATKEVTGKEGRSIDINDSGCSCHDTSSEKNIDKNSISSSSVASSSSNSDNASETGEGVEAPELRRIPSSSEGSDVSVAPSSVPSDRFSSIYSADKESNGSMIV